MMARSAARRRVIFICLLPFLLGAANSPGHAQTRKPMAKEITAIRDCAKKYDTTDLDEVERKCLFNLVATPCTEKPEGQSNVGMADCYRLEGAIWDDLLNENYKSLVADLDDEQKAKLRDMQRLWIAYRDSTCGFYYTKIRGTMAGPMTSACFARETARRAVLLKFFSSL
jgi:uncharacterized protein YecT (DUF1311 family)